MVFSCTNNDDSTFQIKETHLIFIGLDGLGGYNFDKTLSNMPNVRQYSKEGIYTDQKQAVSPTASGPNWASIFMGTTPEVHGYLKWDSKAPAEPYPFEVKIIFFQRYPKYLGMKNLVPKSVCSVNGQGLNIWLTPCLLIIIDIFL